MTELQKVLIHSIASVSLIIFLDVIYGSICSYLYNHTESGVIHSRNYSLRKSNEDILILGSSRAKHHYVPSVFRDSLNMSCYNGGEEGMCIFYHYAVLSARIERGETPQIVILDVQEPDLYESPNAYFNLESAINKLIPYYGEFAAVDSLINHRGPWESVKFLSSSYRYNSLLLSSAKEFLQNGSDENLGYEPLQGTYSPSEEEVLTKPDVKYSCEIQKLDCLIRFVSLCKSANIRLVMSYSPSVLRPDSIRMGQIKQIATDYGATFFDSEEYSVFRDTALFVDEWHLNDEGAIRFSALLSHTLNLDSANR